jgi:sulfonate transport system permease protein
MKNSYAKMTLHVLIAVGLFLVLWSIIARLSTLPSVAVILQAVVEMIEKGTYGHDILISSIRALSGFLIGFGLGAALGVLTGRFAGFSVTLGGLLQFLRWTPVLALVPLTIRLGGLGEGPKIFLIAWACLFVTWAYTHTAVSKMNPAYAWWSDSLGLTFSQRVLKVYAPAIAPALLGAARVALAIALIVDVAAELGGTLQQGFFRGGLGYRISRAIETNRNDVNLACIVTYGAIGMVYDLVLVQFVKRGLKRISGIDFYREHGSV